MRKRLGEILVEKGLVDEDQLSSGLGEQQQWGGKLGSILVNRGFISEADLLQCLAVQQGIKCVSLRSISVSPAALRTLKADDAKRYSAVPISLENKMLTVAMVNPMNLKTIDTLRLITKKNIKPVLAMDQDIGPIIDELYHGARKSPPDSPSAMDMPPEEGPRDTEAKTISVEQTVASLITLLIQKELISEEELLEVLNDLR